MNTKHTPGPWRLHQSSDGGIYVQPESHGDETDICQVFLPYPQVGEAGLMAVRYEANARLIAAAPELLEACKLAVEVLEESARQFRASDCPGHAGNCERGAKAARAAIAKAEGRAV